MKVGDGSPATTQAPNEPINEESSSNVQISESVSFSVGFEKQKVLPGMVQISESVSFSDQLEIQTDIIPEGTIRLNEWISINDEIEGTFGVGLVTISESIYFEMEVGTELYRPLNEMIYISESVELSFQISIDGVAELQINEVLRMSEEITIYTPIIRIEEHLQMYDQEGTQFVEITLNEIPVTNLIPENITLSLNGTSYLETNQDIAESVNQFTISAWIKPEFDAGTPQMVAISKDLTFQIAINNIAEPQHAPVFTIYDGIRWHEVVGADQLEEGKWHHIAGVLEGSEITMFVDGIQQHTISIPPITAEGWLTDMEMGISISESDIVIGADYDEGTELATSKFSGQISGVSVHNKALNVEFINEVIQNTTPYSTTEIILTETVEISDIQGMSGKGVVTVNENISFADMMDAGMIILPRILTEKIDLISLNGTYTNSTLALNGTEYVTIQDVISSEMNTMSISSWIKPEFNSGTPQYTITSKENSFNLYVTNINQPPHTVGFSVFDGVKWNIISGHTTLDDRWHHIMASVNGSNISLYMDGNLENEQTLQNEFSIGNNGQYAITDSQISVSDSEIIVGAYVSTLREEIKTSDKFVGKIATVDVFTDVLTAEQIYHKYETDLSQFYKFVSLYETVQIGDELLDDAILVYEFAINDESYEIDLHENIVLNDLISIIGLDNTVYLEELLNIQETISVTTSAVNTFSVNLKEIISFNDNVVGINPFVPSVNPEIQMVKSGFLITENPKFELEYYSENDAVKIDQQQIVNATSIANQLQEDLASTPGELLSKLGTNEITTAIQVIETRNTIYQLEDQVEQIPEDVNAEDIKELQEKVEEVTESIDETAKKLEETHLVDKAPEIEKSAEIIREAADITQNVNQTGTWKTTDENITTRIIAPDGSIFADEAFFEKEREGKFDVEVLSEVVAKPGIYTVESTITVDETEYTINEEFAWGLVSLNTNKSTYYPGDTAEFEIVVLDSVGSPVCDANLVMSINGTMLSSGAGITPNAECGIYDAMYETGIKGTYHVDISAIAEGIQTGFETTFDVASFVEFDIIRTAQSKIDPVNNPNEFEVVIDVTSHTDATDIQIVESVPSVFEIVSDGIVTETADGKTITWDKILQNQTAQIKYKYSVPMIFPELFPLGEVVISYDNKTFTEARPWFVANDPDFPDDWKKKLLTVDSSLVEGSSNLTNFPVLVTMTDSDFPNNSDGDGIRFTSSDGTTAVPFEIESYSYSGGAGTLTAWVKLTVDHDDDTYFFIHYAQTEAISPDPAANVWTNYVAVNHLKDEVDNNNHSTREMVGSKGDGKDSWSSRNMNPNHASTGQTNHASIGQPDNDHAKIGYALEFAGTQHNGNDRLCLDDKNTDGSFDCSGAGSTSSHFDVEQPNRTVEFWYWAQDVTPSTVKAMFDGGSNADGQAIYIYNSNIYAGNYRDGNSHRAYTNYATTSQEWHHVAFVTNGASTSNTGSGSIILYHDGVKVDEETGDSAGNSGIQVDNNSNQAGLGGIYGRIRDHSGNDLKHKSPPSNSISHYFDGKLDEFRVTNSVLSADYIKTSYNAQNEPTNFVREGIYLNESILLTDSVSPVKLAPGENVLISESIGFTDSATTLSNDDIATVWSKKVLTTNSTMITGSGSSLTGLPVLVELTNDSDLSTGNVGSNGEGIRFTSDGTTFLDFEIETYTGDSDKGSLIAWVEIPNIICKC